MHGGECVLATKVFNVANNQFDWLVQNGKLSAVLADRRSGDVATYYPATGLSVDRRNEDYYQAQKFCLTEQRVREMRAVEAPQIDKPGQWLVKHGRLSDTYFYVQQVQRNGKLKGLTVYFNHDARFEGMALGQTIEKANVPDWKVTYIETVRGLKLDSYLA
jgi:hypothetical protein